MHLNEIYSLYLKVKSRTENHIRIKNVLYLGTFGRYIK